MTSSASSLSSSRGQLGYIHALRGVAILLIVASHTNSFAPDGDSVVEQIYRAILREGTALFVLISGFLFQHLHHGYRAKTFWLSKFYNVAMPYIVMSAPAIFLYIAILPSHDRIDLIGLHEHSALYQVGYFLATGADLMPFWFIPVVLMIFACYPLLRFLAESRGLKYIAIACLVSLLFTQRARYNLDPLIGFAHFLPVYIVGMALHRYWDHWIEYAERYMALLLGLFFVMTFLATVYRDPYAYSSIAIVAKLSLFMLVCALCRRIDFIDLANRSRVLRFFNYLATLSFGIYFVHGYLAAAVSRSPLAVRVDSGALGAALGLANALFITLASIVVVELVRRVAKSYSRMIVGA